MKDAWEDCSVEARALLLGYDQVRSYEENPPPPKEKKIRKR